MENWNWFKGIVLIMVLSALLIVASVTTFILWPHKLFTTNPAVWPVRHAEGLHRGDAILTKIEVCKYTQRTAEIMLLWVGVTDDGEPYVRVLSTTSGSLPEGCKTAVFHVTDVPASVPSGTYRVKSVMRYDMGLMRVEHPFVTEPFRVLP